MEHSRTKIRVVAGLFAMLFVSVVATRASMSAFSDTTENSSNQWTAGSVTLTDNDSGVALFDNLTNLTPGDSEVDCIEVTYSGSLDAAVKLYGATTAGTGLEAYLDLTVERGTGTCGAFTPDVTVWSNGVDGDLGVFLGSKTDFASGADNWTVTGGLPDETVPYRLTVTLQDDNNAQSLTTTVTFTWEAQNT